MEAVFGRVERSGLARLDSDVAETSRTCRWRPPVGVDAIVSATQSMFFPWRKKGIWPTTSPSNPVRVPINLCVSRNDNYAR